MKRLRYPLIAVAIVSFFLVSSQTAFAATSAGTPDSPVRAFYIGPGTLTIIWQVLIGLAIGGVAMMGIYRVRVKMFLADLRTRLGRNRDGETREEDESE